MKEREQGYYWIKITDGWVIGEYLPDSKWWYLTGNDYPLLEDDFLEVDENRIVRSTLRHTDFGGVYTDGATL